MDKTNIIIVEDHSITLFGIQMLLQEYSNIEIIETFTHITPALPIVLEKKPSLLILDINLPDGNGISIARECLRQKLSSKIIFLSSHISPKSLSQLTELSNVYSVISKDSFLKDIKVAIDCILKGLKYYPNDVTEIIKKNATKKNDILHKLNELTKREVKIINMISEHLSTKEISEALFISKETVKKHRSNISGKLGLTGNHNLIKFCIENKYVLGRY